MNHPPAARGPAVVSGVRAVQLSQPEYNDMERIYAHTVDQGINLLGLSDKGFHLCTGTPLE